MPPRHITNMGINGANKVLKERAPAAFFTMPITYLAGKRVAIDAHGWMYANMYTARKKVVNRTNIALNEPDHKEVVREWIQSAITFILGWLGNNITPVFVFDGPHTPDKAATKQDRKEKQEAAQAKIDELYSQLHGDILAQPPDLLEKLRKAITNCNRIMPDDFKTFKGVISAIGIPVLQATGDGEQLCSMLCIEGEVAAVFSTDVDNLAYGCPLTITGFSQQYSQDGDGYQVSNLDCVRHDHIVKGMNMTHQMFVDWCIMCGCDFNKNMKGIAGKKSLDLVMQFGSIDSLPTKFDTTCLNHIRCRELFRYVPSSSLIVKYAHPSHPFDVNVAALTSGRDVLAKAGLTLQHQRLSAAYNIISPSSSGSVESLELGPIPRYVPPLVQPKLTMVVQPKLILNVVRT